MHPKVLFLTLDMFGFTGGIEKVCLILSRALSDMSFKLASMHVYSLYDKPAQHDPKYIRKSCFRAFQNNRLKFGVSSLLRGIRSDIIVISHVNLSIAALLIKALSPKIRIIVYAHGTEVWEKLPRWKSSFLRTYCEVWAVSEYTAEKLRELNSADPEKIKVLPNCLDPYLEIPSTFSKPGNLLKRYQLTPDQPILFTLARLLSNSIYKGYDLIIESLPELIKTYPNIRFLLAGKAGNSEKTRLEKLIFSLNLNQYVIFTGYIPDAELSDHFRLADIFVMPSNKEGFGIVFIEAAASGCKIIGGNQDGSR
ncbi:MAG: glycosyltransferase family 4 protein, partial [Flavobacterium sp.]|nr:glycosyltransferase family 4 protein [Pedobacter sp.]